MKKARVEGMKSHTIILQVNAFRENAEFYKRIYGEQQYESLIVNLLHQLPGVPTRSTAESSTQASSTPTGRRGMEVDLTAGSEEFPRR